MPHFVGKVIEVFDYSDKKIKSSDKTIQASVVVPNGNCIVCNVPDQLKDLKKGDYITGLEDRNVKGVVEFTMTKLLKKAGKETFDTQKKSMRGMVEQRPVKEEIPTNPAVR